MKEEMSNHLNDESKVSRLTVSKENCSCLFPKKEQKQTES